MKTIIWTVLIIIFFVPLVFVTWILQSFRRGAGDRFLHYIYRTYNNLWK